MVCNWPLNISQCFVYVSKLLKEIPVKWKPSHSGHIVVYSPNWDHSSPIYDMLVLCDSILIPMPITFHVPSARINISLFYQGKSWLLHLVLLCLRPLPPLPFFPLLSVTICFKLGNWEECVPWHDQWEGDRCTTCIRNK